MVGSTQLWQPPVTSERIHGPVYLTSIGYLKDNFLRRRITHRHKGRERGKVEDGSRRGKIKMQGKFIPVLVGLALTSSSYVLSIVSVYHENKGWCA